MTPTQPSTSSENQAAAAALRPSIGIDGEDFLLEDSDLSALADLIGARSNALALLPPAEPAANRNGLLDSEFAQLEAAHRQRLAIAIGVLRAPAKIAYLHHTIADETVSRGMLAWSASVPDFIVAVARSGGIRRISFYQAASLKSSITRILDADQDLSDDEIGCKLPSMAVLTFLAILDQLRAVRLYSMLNHTEPSTMFSPDEILDRLAGAAEEDFRWPLLFTDKVVPGMAAALTRDDVSAAFRNLIQANLIEPVIETERSKRYDLTEAGQAICHGVLHDFSKVALSLCDHHPDGQYGHDLVLLIRGPFHLYLFAMAGQEGAVAAVNNDELESVLNRALAPAWAGTPAAVQPSAPGSSAATAVCPRCGGAIAPGQRFCEQCGRAVAPEPRPAAPAAPRVCPGCGHAAAPDVRFCGNCGGLLT